MQDKNVAKYHIWEASVIVDKYSLKQWISYQNICKWAGCALTVQHESQSEEQ